MISLKSAREIALMRTAGKITGNLLEILGAMIKPGITTLELEKFAEKFILEQNAIPAFKGYRHYPYTLCTSVNESVVHEFPSQYVLKEGDIISIDVGVCKDGYYGDATKTFPVGRIDSLKSKLIDVTLSSLELALNKAIAGNRLSDISNVIQTYAETNGFSVVREFTGHGIGSALHEEPVVLNYGAPHRGPVLEPGMTLAIEPMLNVGTYKVKILKNGWQAVTKDGKPSAHFEHTIVITEDKPEILTLPESLKV